MYRKKCRYSIYKGWVYFMKVYCSYNQEFHEFLNKVVKLILDKYGSQLNLDTLEEIELIYKEDLPYETDGKVLNESKIIITSRLYELLPSLKIDNLSNNDDYTMLRKTLYHEMGHINDMVFMPKLYTCVLENFENGNINADSISSLFWIEYLAERRTVFFENVYNLEICDDFVKGKWHCSMTDPYSHYGEKNFYYLTKLLPYFMARTNRQDLRQQYLSRVQNNLLIEYINEIDAELKYLEANGPFDDPIVLKGLYGIIDKHFNRFMNKYKG